MKSSLIIAVIALFASSISFQMAVAQDHPSKIQQPKKIEQLQKADLSMVDNNLVNVATSAGNLTTFVAAVKAAGLTEKLQGKGPFTVFAPTDEAFAKLPEGALDDLLKPANKSKLAGILANHVVPGKIMAADVKTMKATNVSGQDLQIEVHDGEVMVDGARVVKTDMAGGNGVIHAIDTVIIPQGDQKSATEAKPKDHPAH